MSLLRSYIAKSISIVQFGNEWFAGLCADLCEASRTISYVETVSTKADTLHRYASRTNERYLKQAYEVQVREALRILKIKSVELAIDGKQDLYYGEHGGLSVRQIAHEHGADEAWEYLVVAVVWPVRMVLMAVPYWQGADKATLCKELLDYARSLPITIKKVLFDRGFYNAHLIDYLESARGGTPLPYLIFVPQHDNIKEYVTKTTGRLGVYEHEFVYAKDKSTWKPRTTLVVCKNVGTKKNEEPYHWVFATNLKPSRALVRDYRARWNIETGFRIMEEGKIKTKTNNPIVRFFYFLLRALLTLLWVLNSIIRTPHTYKAYLRTIEYTFRSLIPRPKPPPYLPLV
jgi:putative transposase